MSVLAERLAEAGFLVVVPDLPHSVRHEANADAIVALVAVVVAERKLDTLPVVLIGTSAGGLAALLATDRIPRLALWIGLDSVDAFGQSRGLARSLRVPEVVLRGRNSECVQRRRQCAADRLLAAEPSPGTVHRQCLAP